jgi:hypothetical protein
MFNVTLSETQLRDLKVFLERCDLRGVEAARFLSLVQAISQAKPEKTSEKEVETKISIGNI